MKTRLLTTAIFAGLFSLSAQAGLETGATAPVFTAQASMDGEEFTYSLQQTLNLVGPTVVYFYPSAYTQGCNIQAHTFAINMDKFRAAGASVVGVSLSWQLSPMPTAALPHPMIWMCVRVAPASRIPVAWISTMALPHAILSSLIRTVPSLAPSVAFLRKRMSCSLWK